MTSSKPVEKKAAEQAKMQEVAAFRLLPFSVDLFQGDALRLLRATHLPLNEASALTAEVVDALAQVITRGTVAFLARQGGWRKKSVARSGADEPLKPCYGIGFEAWREQGRRLEFSAASIRSALFAYNAVCAAGGIANPARRAKGARARQAYDLDIDPEFERNGDLLAHHLIWRRLRGANFHVDEATQEAFTLNPLTQLVRLDVSARSARAILERLLAPDLEPSWPWLIEYIASSWQDEMKTRWDDLERFDRLNRGVAELGEALFEIASERGRRDYLIVMLRFFSAHLGQREEQSARLERFNRLSRSLRLSDRQFHRNLWARQVWLCCRLKQEYDEARHVHPIDRESADKVFMDAVEREPLLEMVERAQVFVNTLRGVIA